jgi:solute carrier family 25 protein 44
VSTLPIRAVYLSVLEVTKARCRGWEAPAALPEALRTGAADFVAGATASCVTQCLVIPVDVVSQRLMVQAAAQPGGPPRPGGAEVHYRNGLAAARGILATEGMAGLYRGAGASLAIFVPSSGLWWGAYGALCVRVRKACHCSCTGVA